MHVGQWVKSYGTNQGMPYLSSSLDPNTLMPKRVSTTFNTFLWIPKRSSNLAPFFLIAELANPAQKTIVTTPSARGGQGPQGPVSTVLGLSRKENRRSLSLTCAYKQYDVVPSGNLFPNGRAVEKKATWGSSRALVGTRSARGLRRGACVGA